METHDISVVAMEALNGGTSLQAVIRNKLSEDIDTLANVSEIANSISIFRNEAETVIEASLDMPRTRKAVNNIVNDVSRIVRELTGYSIKLKTRKGGYKYQPELFCPKAPKPKPIGSSVLGTETLDEATIRILYKEIKSLKAEIATQAKSIRALKTVAKDTEEFYKDLPTRQPHTLLNEIISAHGIDNAGLRMVAALKEAKAAEASIEDQIPF